jgi:hypothetical protein
MILIYILAVIGGLGLSVVVILTAITMRMIYKYGDRE